MKLILKFAAPLPDIEAYERYLFLGPHPDDIEIGAGATAAKLAAQGKDVCFLICTDGRYGDGAVTPGTDVPALRRAEARASAKVLGVKDVRFLGLSDGGFYSEDELLRGAAAVIADFKPDVIFAPDPCVTSECHADHLNVGNAARRLAEFAPYAGIMKNYGADAAPVQALAFYMSAKCTRFVNTSGYLDKQLQAILECHESQFPAGSDAARSVPLYLKLRAVRYAIPALGRTGEGFRVLGQTHMHCLPEAGK